MQNREGGGKKKVSLFAVYMVLESKGFFRIKAQKFSDDNLPGTVLVEKLRDFYEEEAWESDPNLCYSCTRICIGVAIYNVIVYQMVSGYVAYCFLPVLRL